MTDDCPCTPGAPPHRHGHGGYAPDVEDRIGALPDASGVLTGTMQAPPPNKINTPPGHLDPKTPPTAATVDSRGQQTAIPIRRGTAQRLGLRRPAQWADDFTRTTQPGWGGINLADIHGPLITGTWTNTHKININPPPGTHITDGNIGPGDYLYDEIIRHWPPTKTPWWKRILGEPGHTITINPTDPIEP